MKNNLKRLSIYIFYLTYNFIFVSCYTQLETSPPKEKKSKIYQTSPKENKYETEIRIFLYEKYHPGICFGMPDVIDERIIQGTIRQYSYFADIILEKYNPQSDYKVYEIISSIKSFILNKSQEGYEFTFSSGNCCIISHYKGILYLENNKIVDCKIIRKEVENVPC